MNLDIVAVSKGCIVREELAPALELPVVVQLALHAQCTPNSLVVVARHA